MVTSKGKKYKIIMMGSKRFDLIIGEFEPATDSNPTHYNLVGKRAGLFSGKIIKENMDRMDIEEKEYSRNGDTYVFIRHDLNGDIDRAQLPAVTVAYFKGLEANNSKLMLQVASLQRQLKTLDGESRYKRRLIEDAKTTADVKKAEFSFRGDYLSEFGYPQYPLRR